MKKVASLILIFMIIMSISIITFATDSVLGNGENNNDSTTITGNEYEDAQKNNSNVPSLPQTGAEDYKVGILFTVCAVGAIFAYKKVSDYRDIK